MNLEGIYKALFSQTDAQWDAFKTICELMGGGEAFASLCEQDFTSALEALEALNPVLQKHVFRGGAENPFGPAKERFEVAGGDATDLHRRVAEQLIILGLHRERVPATSVLARALFILGSTIPNTTNRIIFCRDAVLPKVYTGETIIYGLSGERALIPAKEDATRGYLGDLTEEPRDGFLTSADLEPTLETYSKEVEGKREPTEAGAMSVLAERLLGDHAVVTIDAKAKPGKARPDTEDTAKEAGAKLLEAGALAEGFRLAIVSDACFPGQVDQVRMGLLKAGVSLSPDQIEFYGMGYPDAVLIDSAAYTQILASSVLAERVHSRMSRLRLECSMGAAVEGTFGAASAVEAPVNAAAGPGGAAP